MKKILLGVLSVAIISGPIFVLAQTKSTSVAPKTVEPSIKDVLLAITNLAKQFSIMQKEITELKKIIVPPQPPNPPICPIASSFIAPCLVGQTRGPDTKDANGCSWPGQCIDSPEPPKPTACAGGYELYGDFLCFKRSSGLVYEMKKGVETAISLTKYAAANWGTTINGCNGTIEPNSSGTGILCKYASTGGDCGSWVKVAWNYTVSSCVDPSATDAQREAGRKIVDACVGATGQSSFKLTSSGVPESCLVGGTGGGGGGSAVVLPASWEACLNEQGKAAGVTQSKIDTALAVIKKDLGKTYINYSSFDSSLYTHIAYCDKKTGFYISNQGGGTGGGGTGGGGTGSYAWDTAKTNCVAGLITARGETSAKAQTIANNMALCASSAGCTSLDDTARADMSKYSAEGSSSQCWSSGGGGYVGGSSGTSGWEACTNLGTGWFKPPYSSAYCFGTDRFSYQPSGGGAISSCTGYDNPVVGCAGPYGNTGSYTSGGSSSCPSDIAAKLGTGCHFMYNVNSVNIYCNSDMSKHIRGDRPSDDPVNGCSNSLTTGFGRASLIAQLLRLFY